MGHKQRQGGKYRSQGSHLRSDPKIPNSSISKQFTLFQKCRYGSTACTGPLPSEANCLAGPNLRRLFLGSREPFRPQEPSSRLLAFPINPRGSQWVNLDKPHVQAVPRPMKSWGRARAPACLEAPQVILMGTGSINITGSLSEMQIPNHHPDQLSQLLWGRGPSSLRFIKPSGESDSP